VVAPIAVGDLVQGSHFVDVADARDGVAMSLSLPVDRALAGNVGAGERIDVIATYPSVGRAGSETRLVARNVTVITVLSGGDGLNGGHVTLTVELPDLATAQRLQHAVDTAQVAVLRGGDAEAPSPDATTSEGAPRLDTAGPDQTGDEAFPEPTSGPSAQDTPQEQD
jgi:hypothetical protein